MFLSNQPKNRVLYSVSSDVRGEIRRDGQIGPVAVAPTATSFSTSSFAAFS
jgi:hypothetical protein